MRDHLGALRAVDLRGCAKRKPAFLRQKANGMCLARQSLDKSCLLQLEGLCL